MAPLLLLGAWLKQLHLVWLSFAIAEAISIPFGILLYRRIDVYKRQGMGNTNKELAPSCPGAVLKEGRRFPANAGEEDLKAWAEGFVR